MICNNCGKKGHISKKCNQSIKSYGVILIHNIENIPKILLVNRKDSICYIELIMGKYNINDEFYLQKLFERITKDEFNKLNTYQFNVLWMELWVINKIHNKREYEKYLRIFLKLKLIIIKYKIFPKYLITEWEIPKGRRNVNETYYEASLRELEEETNINRSDYEIIINYKPLIETFIGENGVTYENMYYLGICKNNNNIKIDTNNTNQMMEIKDIKLFDENECLEHIRDYNINKKKIIQSVYKFITNYKNDLLLK